MIKPVETPDAFYAVLDRERVRAPLVREQLWLIVNELQRNQVAVWESGKIPLPILVFGRVYRRGTDGRPALREAPLHFCGDGVEAVRLLLAHSAFARLGALGLVRATAFFVALSDPEENRAVIAALKSLPDVQTVRDFTKRGDR